jgi:hypothetical protein
MLKFVAGFFAGVASLVGLAKWLEDAGRGDPQQTMPNPMGWGPHHPGGSS